jgi:hypothetical protein
MKQKRGVLRDLLPEVAGRTIKALAANHPLPSGDFLLEEIILSPHAAAAGGSTLEPWIDFVLADPLVIDLRESANNRLSADLSIFLHDKFLSGGFPQLDAD